MKKLRAKLTSVSELDAALVQIQSDGSLICNLFPYSGSLACDANDVGAGRTEIGLDINTRFVITYLEPSKQI